MTESIEAVVGEAYLKKGVFKKDQYRLVFTNERVIFSHVTKDMIKREQKEFAADLKGKSFKERMSAVFHVNTKIFDRYLHLSIDEILKQGNASFALPYEHIKKVKKRIDLSDDDGTSKPTKLIIVQQSDKLKLSFSDERASSRTYKLFKEHIK